MKKQTIYLVKDWDDHINNCWGRALLEDGTELYRHWSSNNDWLRSDLRGGIAREVGPLDHYELIDLIGKPVPDQFRLPEGVSYLKEGDVKLTFG